MIELSVQSAPPALPEYDQPPIPEEGYIWTPGYWHWDANAGYYWVPGTWVLPPAAGLLWTPPYWGYSGGAYLFHSGYWGPRVGFYGGVNYGYGYGGVGYQGGYWVGNNFSYNRRVNNIGSVRVTNVFDHNVTAGRGHQSFVGSDDGARRGTAGEKLAEHDQHQNFTPEQAGHAQAAVGNAALFAAQNHGRPPIAATPRPSQFEGPGVVAPRPPNAMRRNFQPAPQPAARASPSPVAPAPRQTPEQRPHPPEHEQENDRRPHL